jgi:hypothetical protein
VAGYRLYFLDHARHIHDAIVLECDDDEAACAQVDAHRDGRAMELWLRDRLVMSWPATA